MVEDRRHLMVVVEGEVGGIEDESGSDLHFVACECAKVAREGGLCLV
jgi:hypothetical protein